jgi:hypothetical protein
MHEHEQVTGLHPMPYLGRLGPQVFPPTSMPPGRPVTVGSPVQGFIVGGLGGAGGLGGGGAEGLKAITVEGVSQSGGELRGNRGRFFPF